MELVNLIVTFVFGGVLGSVVGARLTVRELQRRRRAARLRDDGAKAVAAGPYRTAATVLEPSHVASALAALTPEQEELRKIVRDAMREHHVERAEQDVTAYLRDDVVKILERFTTPGVAHERVFSGMLAITAAAAATVTLLLVYLRRPPEIAP